MLSILDRGTRLCDGFTRREALRIGGLGFTGLAWSRWLQARALAAPGAKAKRSARAKACILIFNYGGPSHLDILDLKPDAPREVRGEFKPIATRVPGIHITEHLPLLAKQAHRYAIIRSVTHRDNDHAIGAYLALTGHSHPKHDILGIEPPETPQDLPSVGSLVCKLRPTPRPIFSYVTLGDLRHFGNHDSMGQNAGCLGRAYDPYTLPFVRTMDGYLPPKDGSLDMTRITSVTAAVDASRMADRRQLRELVAKAGPGLEETAATRNLDGFTRRAFELLSSSATRDAFDLDREPQKVRDRYGPTPFAQNCLLARRLIGAGVPLVTLYSFGNRDWDTHGGNFAALKNTLLPPTDRGLSTLLDDLDDRGMLDDTLVLWMGDMGRTPRINGGAGRDHWSFCYSILMAGGGVRGGQVYGSSDRTAAFPSTNLVSPSDVAATILERLGIDPRSHVTDQEGRPLVVNSGQPLQI